MEVAGNRDGQVGRNGAHTPQQLAFPVEHVLGHHRAVQIEQGRVAAAGDRVAHQPRHPFVGVLAHRSRRHRLRGKRGDDLRAPLAGQRHVRGDGHARRAVRVLHRLADVRPPRLESRPVGDDRREGVGLVLHHCDDDAHDRLPARGPTCTELCIGPTRDEQDNGLGDFLGARVGLPSADNKTVIVYVRQTDPRTQGHSGRHRATSGSFERRGSRRPGRASAYSRQPVTPTGARSRR